MQNYLSVYCQYLSMEKQTSLQQAHELDQKLRSDFLKLGKPAKYGTAGFRDLATNMPFISFRVGAFVCLLNKTAPSLNLGVVMSASHNKIEDNGVKITNFSGNMLEMHYEKILEQFMAEQTLEKAISMFKKYLVQARSMNVFDQKVTLFIGGDTRPSTAPLLELVEKGIQSQGGQAINFGLTTTPQLQYYVYLQNKILKPKAIDKKIDAQAIRTYYWNNFAQYFKSAAQYIGWTQESNQIKERYLDCANGVGGVIMPQFLPLLGKHLKITLFNNNDSASLNNGCGADFVKTQCKFPRDYKSHPCNSFISFDGDADRIVQYIQQGGNLRLIDGDRQGTVFTEFFKKITDDFAKRVQKINALNVMQIAVPTNPKIGFVQTYYANYSSSQYLLKQYGMEPVFAATGVKHLHQKAEHYDIGIYFQANGHGTVIFNSLFLNRIEAVAENKKLLLETQIAKGNPQFCKQLEDLCCFIEFYLNCCYLANPSVGDAISNLLLFQLALKYLGIQYKDTLKMYTDLKSKTSKIAVKNKQQLKVTDIEDKVVSPEGLQANIEAILNKHNGKKAFLRASGTQNVLRLHVEAETVDQVNIITKEVTDLVNSNKELN